MTINPNLSFELHPNLRKKSFVIDLPLCRVLLEDNAHYPWIFLVPRRKELKRMMDVSRQDSLQLWEELEGAQTILWESFDLTQLNVAAIGNKTAQLHIHVIGRREGDLAWPGTVWDREERLAYEEREKEALLALLRSKFESAFCL